MQSWRLFSENNLISIKFKPQAAISNNPSYVQPGISSGQHMPATQYRSKPPSSRQRDSRRQQMWLGIKNASDTKINYGVNEQLQSPPVFVTELNNLVTPNIQSD